MLRGVDEIDGPGVYIRNLCSALFRVDQDNRYFLFYQKENQAGRFADVPNVTERVMRAPKLLWDQVMVPIAAVRYRLDVLFHHKFTVPLASPCPTVVQQRGTDYWSFPEWYDRLDRMHAKLAIPVYCRQSSRVLANSHFLADELQRYAGVPRERIEVVYAGVDPRFQRVEDPLELSRVRNRYGLPAQPFFLMVAKGYASVGSHRSLLYPRKNVDGVLRAHGIVASSLSDVPPLVVAGSGFQPDRVERLRKNGLGLRGVVFPGFVEYADMPALYSLAQALVFPSHSESFGIPLIEAMACGCPVITANTTACPEVVSNAGLVVDPDSPQELAAAMLRLATDPALTMRLRRRGYQRAAEFSWERSARKLLAVLRAAGAGKRRMQ
jgi:glycosyltransferase involved in cell wall biosynthesis